MSLWKMTDEEASKPKYLSDTLRNDQTVSDLDSTVSVDVSEETVTANKAKGMQHAGWVNLRSYTDQHGNTRYKAETLVAAGSMTLDAADDSIVADLAITISTQPASVEVGSGSDVTLSVVATINGAVALSYQWYDAADDSAVEGATANTLTLTAITAPASYYVVVTGGTAAATSDTAAITIAA